MPNRASSSDRRILPISSDRPVRALGLEDSEQRGGVEPTVGGWSSHRDRHTEARRSPRPRPLAHSPASAHRPTGGATLTGAGADTDDAGGPRRRHHQCSGASSSSASPRAISSGRTLRIPRGTMSARGWGAMVESGGTRREDTGDLKGERAAAAASRRRPPHRAATAPAPPRRGVPHATPRRDTAMLGGVTSLDDPRRSEHLDRIIGVPIAGTQGPPRRDGDGAQIPRSCRRPWAHPPAASATAPPRSSAMDPPRTAGKGAAERQCVRHCPSPDPPDPHPPPRACEPRSSSRVPRAPSRDPRTSRLPRVHQNPPARLRVLSSIQPDSGRSCSRGSSTVIATTSCRAASRRSGRSQSLGDEIGEHHDDAPVVEQPAGVGEARRRGWCAGPRARRRPGRG